MSDTSQNQPDAQHIADLRAAADENPALKSQLSTKDREIEFLRAGVNTGTLFGRNVMEAHGDKPITTEAIVETVTQVRADLGLPPEGENVEESTELTAEERMQQTQQQARGEQLPAGSEPIVPPKDLIDIAADTYTDARRSGIGEMEAQEAAIGAIIREGAVNPSSAAHYNREAFLATAAEHGHGAEHAGLPERSYEKVVQNSR